MTDKKIAVVTGSSSGIGLGTVKLLAEKGYAVFVTYFKDKDWGEKAVKEITEKGGEATLAQVDVMSEESVKKLFDLVNKKYGKLDVLVNDAAVDYATQLKRVNLKIGQSLPGQKLTVIFSALNMLCRCLKNLNKGM